MQVDVNALGDLIADLIADAVEPLRKDNAELREKLAALEAREPLKGDPGKDSDPVDVDAIAEAAAEAAVSALFGSERLDTLADLKAAEAVAKHFEANPVRDGKDGERGLPGERGEKGDPGADGVGLAGALIDRDGALVVTLTNGEQKSLGPVVGKDGERGKDGADFTDFEIDYDGERHITIKGRGGDIVKRLPIPLDKGYYRDGMACEKGDIVTQDGTAWIALRDTKAKPTIENKEDWRLFARKGRDGKDGRNGIDKTTPAKVASNA